MSDLLSRCHAYRDTALQALQQIDDMPSLKEFQGAYLGKKSELQALLSGLKDLSPEEKQTIAPQIQAVRGQLFEAFESKRKAFEDADMLKKLETEWLDVTQKRPIEKGAIHPIARIQRDVEKVFTSLGFEIGDGPEVETEWRNFDALNIPPTHPARDMQDTFWIAMGDEDTMKNYVLRTHTSNLQIRTMMQTKGPVKAIFPGRVYRNEDIDATHDAIFYQVEGLLLDKDISLAHLKGVIKTMFEALFEKELHVRFRPGYFPFVEPGLEVDMSCPFCPKDGSKCRVCKDTKWIEFMGAGMVHPNVLRNCGMDPAEYSGFAFGFGLTRLAMIKYGIDDIRHLFSQKKEFLSQF